MTSHLAALALGALLAVGAFAQSSFHVSAPSAYSNPLIPGAPYSGLESIETVRTLADGTHITHKLPVTKVYRDSQGRTRREREIYAPATRPGQPAIVPPVVVEIRDPAARVKYVFDAQKKLAHRQELPAVKPINLPMRMTPSSLPPQPGVEQLGTQTIEGVRVEGLRTTSTMPTGAQGNDRPITIVRETWMAPELLVTILSKSSDPSSGEFTQKLTAISRSEPDPSLFQLPADYTVVDEKGDFTITWEDPRR